LRFLRLNRRRRHRRDRRRRGRPGSGAGRRRRRHCEIAGVGVGRHKGHIGQQPSRSRVGFLLQAVPALDLDLGLDLGGRSHERSNDARKAAGQVVEPAGEIPYCGRAITTGSAILAEEVQKVGTKGRG
jgi:hypothetical protein